MFSNQMETRSSVPDAVAGYGPCDLVERLLDQKVKVDLRQDRLLKPHAKTVSVRLRDTHGIHHEAGLGALRTPFGQLRLLVREDVLAHPEAPHLSELRLFREHPNHRGVLRDWARGSVWHAVDVGTAGRVKPPQEIPAAIYCPGPLDESFDIRAESNYMRTLVADAGWTVVHAVVGPDDKREEWKRLLRSSSEFKVLLIADREEIGCRTGVLSCGTRLLDVNDLHLLLFGRDGAFHDFIGASLDATAVDNERQMLTMMALRLLTSKPDLDLGLLEGVRIARFAAEFALARAAGWPPSRAAGVAARAYEDECCDIDQAMSEQWVDCEEGEDDGDVEAILRVGLAVALAIGGLGGM